MSRDLLGCECETVNAVALQKMCALAVWAIYLKQTAVESPKTQTVEPASAVHRVENLNPLDYCLKYFLCVLRQFFLQVS